MTPRPALQMIAALLALQIAACERDATAPPPPATVAPVIEGPWRLKSSATAGAALVFSDDERVERLRLICRRIPAEFVVQAPDVVPIGSEERFTLGFGEQLFTLVADVGSGLPFVEARAPPTPELVAALRSGAPVAANYGATDLGPHPAPPADLAEAFARDCAAEG